MLQAMIMPKKYFFDKNGNPLTFGKVYTYQAGTNNPKPTYTTEAGDVENANPVVLNGEGYATIYIDGSYKIVVDDADDNNIWTEDPVSSTAGDEWVNCSVANYVAGNEVAVSGNVVDLFDVGRSARITNTASGEKYSSVSSISFAAGSTNIHLADAIVNIDVETICASIIGTRSAVTKASIGLYTDYEFPNITGLISGTTIGGEIVDVDEGMICRVINSNQNSLYEIKNSATVDGFGDHSLSNGRFAILIPANQEITVFEYGAKGDGVQNDLVSITAAYNAVLAGKAERVLFPVPTVKYLVLGDATPPEGVKVVGVGKSVKVEGATNTKIVGLHGSDRSEGVFFRNGTDFSSGGEQGGFNIYNSPKSSPVEDCSPVIYDLMHDVFHGRGWLDVDDPLADSNGNNVRTHVISSNVSAGDKTVQITNSSAINPGTLLTFLYVRTFDSVATYNNHQVLAFSDGVATVSPSLGTMIAGEECWGTYRDQYHASKMGLKSMVDSLLDANKGVQSTGFGGNRFGQGGGLQAYRMTDIANWAIPILGANVGTVPYSQVTNGDVRLPSLPGVTEITDVTRTGYIETNVSGGGIATEWFVPDYSGEAVARFCYSLTSLTYDESGDSFVIQVVEDNEVTDNTNTISVITVNPDKSRVSQWASLPFIVSRGRKYRFQVTQIGESGTTNRFWLGDLRFLRSNGNSKLVTDGSRIILLGDSWFANPGFEIRLRERLPESTVIRAGVGGNRAFDLLSRVSSDALQYNPDYVFISTSTNDWDAGVNPNDYWTNMQKLVNKIEMAGAKAIIAGTTIGPEVGGTFAKAEDSRHYLALQMELWTQAPYWPVNSGLKIPAVLEGSWVNFASGFIDAAYSQSNDGVVHIHGSVKSGSGAIFTLPSGMRPSGIMRISINGDGSFGLIQINSSGIVSLNAGLNTFVCLDGINFKPD